MKRSRVRFACSQFLALLACQSGYEKSARNAPAPRRDLMPESLEDVMNVIAPSHAQPAYEI